MGYRLTEGQFDAPAESTVVDGLSSNLGVTLPKDYTKFLKEHNGGEGFIGDNYIIFFKAEELADFNREYEVEKYAPGILLFASTGGGKPMASTPTMWKCQSCASHLYLWNGNPPRR